MHVTCTHVACRSTGIAPPSPELLRSCPEYAACSIFQARASWWCHCSLSSYQMGFRKPRLLELFSGTGSVGLVAARLGWEVVSVDLDPTHSPTVCVDLRSWDPALYGVFDWIHASPPCTEYSIAKTRGIRDIETANTISARARAIVDRSKAAFTIENPATSLLKDQPAVQGLPWVDADYCAFGFPYRKSTRIWTNMPLSLPRCTASCQYGGKHPLTVQSAPPGIRARIPPSLCVELALAALRYSGCEYAPRVALRSLRNVPRPIASLPPSPPSSPPVPPSSPVSPCDPPTASDPTKVCATCGNESSDRWYRGPTCRTCYRRGRLKPSCGPSTV